MDDTPHGIEIDAFHESVLAAIRAAFPAFQDVADYPREPGKIPTPACYLQMVEANPAPDRGTDQLALTLRFEALVIYGFKVEKSKRSVRGAAVALAAFIRSRRWGEYAGPATVEGIQADGFSPELDAYNVWRVDWTQEVVIGDNVWEAGTPAVSTVDAREHVNPFHGSDTINLIPGEPDGVVTP